MTLDDAYNKYLQPEQLTIFLAKNELYYQLSLSYYLTLSTFDIDDACEKLLELNLQVDTSTAYLILKEILERFSYQDDFESKIDDYIKISACFQSLEDFVHSDKGLLNDRIFKDTINKKIEDGTFFTVIFQKQFDELIDESIKKWRDIISAIE